MRKKTQILSISIAILAVALIGELFVVMYYSMDKSTEPTDETSKLSLILPERLLVAPGISLYGQIVNAPPCTDGRDKMNLEEPTEFITYFEFKKGLRIQVPYNPQWGAPYFRFNPYDKHKEASWNIMYEQRLDGISFGKPYILDCDGGDREFYLEFAPAETKTNLIARIKKTYSNWDDLKIITFDVDGKMVVQYTYGPFDDGESFVMGRKNNYILIMGGRFPLTQSQLDIVKSMQFID